MSSELREMVLTRTLEDLLECFDDTGDGWGIESIDGLIVRVSPDIDSVIEKALNVLYREEDEEAFDSFESPLDE